MKKLLLLLLMAGGCANTNSAFIGRSFLGAPYQNSPLGEGMLPDPDPTIRFDVFDCTTFVETVLAGGDENKLNQIRYKDGVVGFLTRNHFIETDWLTNNAGRVQNVSSKYAPVKIRRVEIDKSNWFRVVYDMDVDVAPVVANLEYIPYESVADVQITYPMIVLFITDNPKNRDKIGTDLAVVHMGFLLPNGILRHASSECGRVVDVDFDDYVAKRMKNKNNLGVALVEMKNE